MYNDEIWTSGEVTSVSGRGDDSPSIGSSIQLQDDAEAIEVQLRLDRNVYCKECSEEVYEDSDSPTGWSHALEEAEDGHLAKPSAADVAPANWAGVEVNERRDTVTLSLSVGTPRGAFQFKLRRKVDPETGETTLLLRVPSPEDPGPTHCGGVREIYPGLLEIIP